MDITKEELIEVLDMYFDPLFQLIGAGIAVLIIGSAILLFIKPFMRRL